MNDRRAFFAKLFASSAAVAALASASDEQPLIVIPQPGTVKLYSRVPEPVTFMTRNNWTYSDRITPDFLSGIGNDLRTLGAEVHRLNEAVFGGTS